VTIADIRNRQLRATGWSSGPKRRHCDHAHQVTGSLESVLETMMEDLAGFTARAEPGESVRIHLKVRVGDHKEAEGE